jgi:hypothetical protein
VRTASRQPLAVTTGVRARADRPGTSAKRAVLRDPWTTNATLWLARVTATYSLLRAVGQPRRIAVLQLPLDRPRQNLDRHPNYILVPSCLGHMTGTPPTIRPCRRACVE